MDIGKTIKVKQANQRLDCSDPGLTRGTILTANTGPWIIVDIWQDVILLLCTANTRDHNAGYVLNSGSVRRATYYEHKQTLQDNEHAIVCCFPTMTTASILWTRARLNTIIYIHYDAYCSITLFVKESLTLL